ncbi:serine/threonine-protein kinase pim-2 [Labeo rohita]|uniref:serine/threonine-protein kinase pim-2 n=1 Tax=Labeo rohita TaxID=84645 RepID=UPI0021E32829|nr:serine/threonine-protein kinase pim-2 [Labeo rohita]
MSSRLSSISEEGVESQLSLHTQSVMEAPVEKSSTEKHTSWRKKKTMSSFFKRICKAAKLPFYCSQDTVESHSGDPQFDISTPDVNLSISKESVESLELLSLSSQDVSCFSVGTCIIRRGTVDSLEGENENRLSNSDSYHEESSFVLPGEVPVESVGASACMSLKAAPKLDDTTPDVISKDSIERLQLEATVPPKATEERRKRKGVRSFFKRMWKAMKRPFHSKNKVEPFVPPPPELDDPEPSPAPEPLDFGPTNESIHSRYRVKKPIGEGGYGKVHEGIRISDGKKVAIKRIRKTPHDQYLQIPGYPKPLITEVALLLMMREEPISSHAIQLYEWFEHPRKFTLIMEFPDPCESLFDYINNNPQISETTAQVIMRQAVQAVQHCIERGVFHNDIHPENILLRKHTLELKLIDFGCGHLLNRKGYDCRKYRGIRAYFPPELLIYGKFYAVQTNVWALGVLLYEMMNKCPPFRDIKEITQAKVRFANPDLSGECRDLILQCLTRDLTERPVLEEILQHDWFQTVDVK